mmetsp:Transcript_37205/g.43285  ORF Transcript_37205/g.43285 Transcript_37205/m.43285 type:complete len:510 (-) Transcript_37205:131-1660(-)
MKRTRPYKYEGNAGERAPKDTIELEFESNLTKIKECAFLDCCNISSVIMTCPVTVIENRAFFGCSSIGELCLSSSLKILEAASFYGCSSLPVLFLSPDLVIIADQAFRECSSLATIIPRQKNVPLSLKIIGVETFGHCSALTQIPFFPALHTIGSIAFAHCSSLTEVTLSPSIQSASRDSFYACTALVILRCTYRTSVILPCAVTHVTIDPSTTRISNSAFANCDKLHSIVITPAITKLGSSSFWNCQKLPADFVVPNTVVEIGVGAFARCNQFTDNATNLPADALYDIYTFMGGIGDMIPNNVIDLVVDENVTEIHHLSFEFVCQGLKFLTIQSKNIHIRTQMFKSLEFLKEVTFKNEAMLTIEDDSFSYCYDLEFVTMPKAVNWVLEGSLRNNVLTNSHVQLPQIHERAFDGCPSDVAVTYKRYSKLHRAWKWIWDRERIHASDNKNSSCQISTFGGDDYNILQQTFLCNPPREIIDSILDILCDHDIFFRNFPREVVHTIIQFLPA